MGCLIFRSLCMSTTHLLSKMVNLVHRIYKIHLDSKTHKQTNKNVTLFLQTDVSNKYTMCFFKVGTKYLNVN
jgi:hypothetical protein